MIDALGGSVSATKVFDICYGNNLVPRQIITFKKYNAQTIPTPNDDLAAMMKRIDVAHKFVEKDLFVNGLSGGVHAVELKIIKELCEHIGVMANDSFWDIGVGIPLLAFSLSAAADNGVVLGTDIREILLFCLLPAHKIFFFYLSNCLQGYNDQCGYLCHNPQQHEWKLQDLS